MGNTARRTRVGLSGLCDAASLVVKRAGRDGGRVCSLLGTAMALAETPFFSSAFFTAPCPYRSETGILLNIIMYTKNYVIRFHPSPTVTMY